MSAERSFIEKVGKRLVLAGASLLTIGQIACKRAEPIVQAPTPSQGVATEVVPFTSTPEEPTNTPEPKPQVKIPGEPGGTYLTDLRLKDSNKITGKIFMGITQEGVIVGYSTVKDCGNRPGKISNAFFINALQPTERLQITDRSIKFQRPNAILDTAMPASDNRFFGNLSFLAGGGCEKQELNFTAGLAGIGQESLEEAALQVLKAIDRIPASPKAALDELFTTCDNCRSQLPIKQISK